MGYNQKHTGEQGLAPWPGAAPTAPTDSRAWRTGASTGSALDLLSAKYSRGRNQGKADTDTFDWANQLSPLTHIRTRT